MFTFNGIVAPVIMTVATSDSGGGAGIQADLKTATVLGGFGVSVIAALTAQNGAEVKGVCETPADFIQNQFTALEQGFPIKAAKTGMLPSTTVVEALMPFFERKNYPLVIDPVAVSQSGYQFLQPSALESIKQHLVPLADVITPNIPEIELLTGITVSSSKDIAKPIEKLLAMGAKAVLLKGGHLEEFEGSGTITDWLALPNKEIQAFTHNRVETTNNHGTGCTLAAAIATFLGFGLPIETAVTLAQQFLSFALAASFNPGIGCGPPNVLGGAMQLRQMLDTP